MSDLTDITRKLVAVFAADVEGYSRLMGADEVGTLKGFGTRGKQMRFLFNREEPLCPTISPTVFSRIGRRST